MKNIEKLVSRMRRLWVLEHTARRGLLIVALGADALLACWLAGRFAPLPGWTIPALAGLAAMALAVLAAEAVFRSPSRRRLARLLDERAGQNDLFASAMEFSSRPEPYGPLGELTCELAQRQAQTLSRKSLPARWSLGSRPKWLITGAAAILLLAANGILGMSSRHQAQPSPVAVAPPPPRMLPPATTQTPEKTPDKVETIASKPAIIEDTQPVSRPAEETVKITNEMIDKYLAQMPEEKVDLEGATPIRWDEDEKSGKAQPNEAKAGDKIDPVKLDAALLKDLQTAKKTKEEGGGKEGGVDIAVMADKGTEAAKGKEGGKKGDESLANAVSKDPRGEARRLGIPMEKKGFPVRSWTRFPSKQKGEDRPMGLLEFFAAMERLKTMNLVDQPAGEPQAIAAENVVHPETVPDSAAGLTEAYFNQLRKADK